MGYSNSPLVSYTLISPNQSGARNLKIDRITPHCVVGQCTVQALGELFYRESRQASSNYGIGYDGTVGMYVPESNRAWTSSSGANDNRAVTIEIASDTYAPYKITNSAYATAVKLMADICQRNGKKKLVWISDKNKALAYSDNGQQSDEMLITLHQWFASTICPGDYIKQYLNDMVDRVNQLLNGSTKRTLREEAQYMITNNINGRERIALAEADGFNPDEVQAEIDLMLGKNKVPAVKDLIPFMPTVKGGKKSYTVYYLQIELKRMGYYDGELDGECGDQTVKAIKTLQYNWNKVYGGYAVDGVFGTACWTRLLS